MDLTQAQQVRDDLNKKFSDENLKSIARTTPADESNAYRVEVILSPGEDEPVEAILPDGVRTVLPNPLAFSGQQYVKRTPRTPSQNTDDFGFYPSWNRRLKDGPSTSPDVNPAYPGLRRIPEIQDLVRRVGANMKNEDISSRLVLVGSRLRLLDRLAKHAYAASEAETLVLDIAAELKKNGHTGRNKVVRLVKDLETAMRSDGYFED